MLAQVDALSGGSGWVGAGLLGAVLCWLLLKHLPDKDRQSSEKDQQIGKMVETRDRQIQQVVLDMHGRMDMQRKEFGESLVTVTKAFEAETLAERAACEKHFATLAASMNTAFTTLGEQLKAHSEQLQRHSERNQQWIDLLKRDIEQKLGKAS